MPQGPDGARVKGVNGWNPDPHPAADLFESHLLAVPEFQNLVLPAGQHA